MISLFKKNKGPIPVDKLTFTPLSFNLSGHILKVSIPDNVSPDMPPTELLPNVELNASDLFIDSNKIPLMKVMYDFPKPGWRKQDYGSMIMTIWLHKKPASYNGDIFEREHLIKAIQMRLKDDYQAFNDKVWNEGLAAGKLSTDLINEIVSYSPNIDEEIKDHYFNNRLWVQYFIGGLEKHRIYCAAISPSNYISIDFEDLNSQDTFFDEMIEISTPYSDRIMESVELNIQKNQSSNLSSGMIYDNS